jgi:hypothetical protein
MALVLVLVGWVKLVLYFTTCMSVDRIFIVALRCAVTWTYIYFFEQQNQFGDRSHVRLGAATRQWSWLNVQPQPPLAYNALLTHRTSTLYWFSVFTLLIYRRARSFQGCIQRLRRIQYHLRTRPVLSTVLPVHRLEKLGQYRAVNAVTVYLPTNDNPYVLLDLPRTKLRSTASSQKHQKVPSFMR